MIDGFFSPNEWLGSVDFPIDDSVSIKIIQSKKSLFIGIESIKKFPTHFVDLFIRDTEDQTIYHLHVSFQIGERKVKDFALEDTPKWNWGFHDLWISNDLKMNNELANSEGTTKKKVFPYQGIEFQISKKKFKGTRIMLRAEVSDFTNSNNVLIFPPNSARKDPSSWFDLTYK